MIARRSRRWNNISLVEVPLTSGVGLVTDAFFRRGRRSIAGGTGTRTPGNRYPALAVVPMVPDTDTDTDTDTDAGGGGAAIPEFEF
jgi:hypothetical protein